MTLRVNALELEPLSHRAALVYCAAMADTRSIERAIAGALRAAINDHGPIDLAGVGSAVKRIVGNLANARLGQLAAAEMGRARWKGMSHEDRQAVASLGGRTAWGKLSAKERSVEMKRRAALRAERRAKQPA